MGFWDFIPANPKNPNENFPCSPGMVSTRKNKEKSMKNTRSSRLILNEMERLESLSGRELQNYISELRDALYHERKAMNVREFRLREKLNEVTKAVTTVTETVTSDKEERSEKENLPPTPPIREKGKKEEMPPAAATRASRVRGECPSWEQVKERAEVSLKCRDLDWLREWFAEQECSAWHDGNGNPMRNWGRALAIAWRYREVDLARRDPERRFADGRAGETEIAGDLIAKQMAELGKAVR